MQDAVCKEISISKIILVRMINQIFQHWSMNDTFIIISTKCSCVCALGETGFPRHSLLKMVKFLEKGLLDPSEGGLDQLNRTKYF